MNRSNETESLALLLAQSADAYVVTDVDGVVCGWSDAAERSFGWTESEVVGLDLGELIFVSHGRERYQSALQCAIDTAGVCVVGPRLELTATDRVGHACPVELSMTMLFDPAGPTVHLLLRDATAGRTPSVAGLVLMRERGHRLASLPGAGVSERGARRREAWAMRERDERDCELPRRLLEFARTQAGADIACLEQLRGTQLVRRVATGDLATFRLSPVEELLSSRALSFAVGAPETPVAVPDLRRCPQTPAREALRARAIGAYAGVPVLLSDNRLHAVLCVAGRAPNEKLNDGVLTVLQSLAGILAAHVERVDDVVDSHLTRAEASTRGALVVALAAHDRYTGAHSHAVAALSRRVAYRLGLDERAVDSVEEVALLHDLGKVGIPDTILGKPGPLTAMEWAVMREHPAIGARIVAAIGPLAHLARAIRAEHENWDGLGYPDGLGGRTIPIEARIVCACDAYHAMVSTRAYGPTLTRDAALAELEASAGRQFDPAVVDAMLRELSVEHG